MGIMMSWFAYAARTGTPWLAVPSDLDLGENQGGGPHLLAVMQRLNVRSRGEAVAEAVGLVLAAPR
jgi:hypothetical protein